MVVVRIGVLTVATSLWWMAGLWCQGKYGIDVLRYLGVDGGVVAIV